MSSVTTSTTVCPPADQPCSSSVGVKTWTRRGALGAEVGRPVVRDQGAVQLLRGAVADVVGRDVPVVGLEERTDLVVWRPAGTGAALRQRDRLGEQVGLL